MFYYLTEAVTRRLILELRSYWSTHPKYPNLPSNIQGKFSFDEVAQEAIVVRVGSASGNPFSSDNYQGMVYSYVMKSRLPNKPGHSIEWIREDSVAIQNNGGRFPSPPGIYYLDIKGEQFYVDILHDVAETLDDSLSLSHGPVKGTLRLVEMPSQYLMVEGQDYTLDGLTVVLESSLKRGYSLQAFYRHPAETRGPFPIGVQKANNNAIPGVVLAFGRKVEEDDQLSITVTDSRVPTALEYGGKWELSVEIEILARDVHRQREIADQTAMYLLGVLRSRLGAEGLELEQISIGGDGEDQYDQNDMIYTSNLSLTAATDWSIHVPIPGSFRSVSFGEGEDFELVPQAWWPYEVIR